MDDLNEIAIKKSILLDFIGNNDEYDSEEDDDQVKDTEDDQDFDQQLTAASEQETATASEQEKPDSYGDEEQDSSDSGIVESNTSDIEGKSVESLPVVSKPNQNIGRSRGGGYVKKASNEYNQQLNADSAPSQTVARGRGRYVTKALDEYNQELPAPRIRDVEQQPLKVLKIARLPPSYYRKREDPEIKKQRRAAQVSAPLIDFRAKLNHIAFIVDKDDSDDKGYQHACRRFQEIQSDEKLNTVKPYHDIWSFGLYIYPIAFGKSISCNLLDLIPEKADNEENRPFWFMFKRPPKFENLTFTNPPPVQNSKGTNPPANDPSPRKGILIQINREICADLSTGALISMTQFCVQEDHIYMKKNQWSFLFYDEFFEIQTIISRRLNNDSDLHLTQIKYKIPLDIIDRAVIFHLKNDGFSLFVNMKGNIHELHRERQRRKDNDVDDQKFVPFKRQGIGKHGPQPLFSTIRIRLRVKNNDELTNLFDRQGEIKKNTPPDEINQLIQTTREKSLNKIRGVFKHLLDFFYTNRIHVCFGPIYQRFAPIEQLNTLKNQEFPSFIQSYSWAMLCSISFRIQMRLILSKNFIKRLHDYSEEMPSDDSYTETNHRFYRLCSYLYRRSSEYFFLDLDEEIEIGIEEYETRLKRRNFKPQHINELKSSTAYIPSVALTPTTIKIRPLKLCKLNRVLRARKEFGSVMNFALIELRDEGERLLFPNEFRSLKNQILGYLTNGFHITSSRIYKYLHHSQSQVKCKQFWFYYHNEDKGYLSHEAAYVWMGNFEKERVVAKHAARIALCFTSTDATIRIPAKTVTYVRDVKDVTKTYTFTDGVGTISTQLRDAIKEHLAHRYAFSVLQIRYGGCKGTLSVDPRLDNQEYQLHIRDSMNKFTSDHDTLELCKLSAPRALYLNRQDIVLLESRNIPHTTFLQLQNEDHFWLIRALLSPSIAYELLSDKILPIFQLDRIARKLNIVEEQFFIKLIITCAFNIIRELIDRTRIRISNKKARNMFGIVDEYGVLEYGQVFVQYSLMREHKLDKSQEENTNECKILEGKVVVTKNPCHHPGDLRVFEAVNPPELRYLTDVIVFPQKGHRPHSNEISGSDLDGDEYVVIWLEDLIPKTPNKDPYDYDSQGDPPKLNRPITREDINQVVMEVSEQDCLGSLSNIHLAYADRDGIESEVCTKLAGSISQEVDAAKTGKHPLSEEEIIDLRKGLGGKWPDFMKGRGKKEFVPSKRVLGKLYRSARRGVTGWSRAISNHGNPRHIQLALALTAGKDLENEETDESLPKANVLLYYKQPLDPYIFHPNSGKYLSEIKQLYSLYRSELLEVISLYRFQDEIDLLCRCESMDASAGGSKKGSLEDTAAIEVQNLTRRIIQDFYHEFDIRYETLKCCKYIEEVVHDHVRRKRINCESCSEGKFAKAACAYKYSYEQSNRLPLKSNRRILSFPWLFSDQLLRLRERNNSENIGNQTDTIVGRACSLYLKDFTPKFKVLISINSLDNRTVEFYYEEIEEKRTNSFIINKKPGEKLLSVSLLRACFIEILNDWLTKEKVFGNECIETDSKPLIPESIWHELMINFLSGNYQSNVRLLSPTKYQVDWTKRYQQTIENYRPRWTNTEYQELQKMFDEIHSIAAEHAKTTEKTIWNYLDEYIILALQCISIEKKLVAN